MSAREKTIRFRLLTWFGENSRQLPWRNSKNPYYVWLSEIIMQQTRVAQGTPYYLRFVEKYPSVQDLADAPEQEVLKLWQGLGYYSRARNLHATAKKIVQEYGGNLPEEYKEVVKLKGIGEYTAAAILSIAHNKPYAALDGNVYRVLSRLYADELPINAPSAKKHYQHLADTLLDRKQPGAFNEAMMEFGATICIPRNPLCEECPLKVECFAYRKGLVNVLPVKEASKPVRDRWFHYFYIHTSTGLYLSHRPAGDIWQGLYDFPMLEKNTQKAISPKEMIEAIGLEVKKKPTAIHATRHLLSHQALHISFYEIKLEKEDKGLSRKYRFVKFKDLEKYPLPKPVEKFLNGLH
jgi:A/G-specific adenine glycosylase